MPDGVVGRDQELEAAAEFLGELESGPAALVFEGEPGIGKTTVWAAAEELAPRDFVLLSTRPVEPEVQLAFAALADLLAPVVDEALPDLPGPQRHALAVALLREDPGPRRLDRRAVFAATLSVLRALAASRPVLVSIDDLQWLDRPSASALEYALRRVGELPVGILACERVADESLVSLDLERTLPEGSCRRVRLEPLSLAALHEILKRQLRRSLPRRTLLQVERTSGGNPFFALELARSLPQGADPNSAILSLPHNLLELVRERIERVPRRARKALLAASALGAPTVELVSAAMGRDHGEALHSFERAESAGVVVLEGAHVRFAHPLYAAAVYSSATPRERRLIHRRLSEVVADGEEQARHLALGAEQADEQLASTIEAAAEHARRRGAPEVAAKLSELARALTPPDRKAERRRRTVQTAEYLFHAGELQRAREMLEGVLRAASGRERVDALRLLGEIRWHEENFPEAIRLFEEALEHVGEDLAVEAVIESRYAFAVHATGDFEEAKRHADRALELAEELGEPALLAEALAVSVMPAFLLGLGLDEAKLERALRLEDPYRPAPVEMRPSLCAGYLALFVGELDRCRSTLSGLRERILEQGEESDLPAVSSNLSWAACWKGELAAAAEYGEEAVEAATRVGSESMRCYSLGFAAVVAAYAGDAAVARNRADECLALVARTGFGIASRWACWAQALLALSLDDPEAADAALGPLAAMFEERFDPITAFFLPDEIEALIGLGRLEEAEGLLVGFEETARRLERRWAVMLAARCRALLHAARGELEAAAGAARAALDLSDGLELLMEVARTNLVAGQIERRRRRKRAAADNLSRALEFFEHAGARLWAERARAELERVGLRHIPPDELTPTEQRVAVLAASGLTNREVAAQLFLSPKTVEANLVRIYRKLGIRSRAELGARLAHGGARARTDIGKHPIPFRGSGRSLSWMSGGDVAESYLVECYWPGVDEVRLAAAVQRIRNAASEIRRSGRRVDFRGSILILADETVFCLFDGAEQDVRAVSEQADVPFERVIASLRIDGAQATKEDRE